VRDNGFIIGSNPAAGHPGWDEIGANSANFMAPPSLPRVRAYSLNTLAVSPPLVSEIFSAPGNVRINGKI